MFLKVDNVGAERMSSGTLFQATGPATQNARLPSCSLVLWTNKSPQAARTDSRKVANIWMAVKCAHFAIFLLYILPPLKTVSTWACFCAWQRKLIGNNL